MPFVPPRPPQEPNPVQRPPAIHLSALLGELAAVLYVALIALVAQSSGLFYILFPELGALSFDVLKRPQGTWARAPLMLVVTPFLAGLVGTLVTRNLAYGPVSILVTIGSAILIIRLLRSPIAPAISAGLLPLVLGVSSWWYPLSLLVGTISLAGIIFVRSRIVSASPAQPSLSDRADDIVEETPGDYSWIIYFLAFLAIAIVTAWLTGWRFVLFPPLVVIAFEMFAHPSICPWAGKPFVLSVACVMSATAGVVLVEQLGHVPLAAACSIAFSAAVLRVFDLHVPPALAVGLLPFVMERPTYTFPIAVGIGTLLLAMSFLTWRRMTRPAARAA